MSEPRLSFKEPPHSLQPMRIRCSDIPALFSEGAEREADDCARWPHVETKKLRLKMAWSAFFGRLADRTKNFWLRDIRA